MKAFILALGVLSLILTLWTLAAILLSRIRGWQVRRTLRRLEGLEFPPPSMRWHLRVDYKNGKAASLPIKRGQS